MYYASLTMLAVLGLFVSHFFYCGMLVDYIARSQTLQNITSAVTHNWKAISLTVWCPHGACKWRTKCAFLLQSMPIGDVL